VLAIALCIFLFAYGVSKTKGNTSAAALFSLGVGAVNTQTLMSTGFSEEEGTTALLHNVIRANAPQLIFSLIYFTYNGMFTTLSLATEWSSFGSLKGRKGLRRSGGSHSLDGAQRSAYFLQLPYRFGLPLVVVSGGLHWLMERSIFLVYVESYIADTETYTQTVHQETVSSFEHADIITCGWSPLAVVLSIVVGCGMLVLLVAFGFRPLATGMPIVGSCSAAIAAACHPPPYEKDAHIWEKPLQWGETLRPVDDAPGHCSFTAGYVEYPAQGGRYL